MKANITHALLCFGLSLAAGFGAFAWFNNLGPGILVTAVCLLIMLIAERNDKP